MWKAKTYTSWQQMMHRCYSRACKDYDNYGGAGILACEFLRASPLNLLALLGSRPDGHSLDRIKNNHGYWCGSCAECSHKNYPKNIRWATPSQQVRNRDLTLYVEIERKKHYLQDIANEVGTNYNTILRRFQRGVPVVNLWNKSRAQKKYEINGVSKSATEWSRHAGINRSTFHSRVKYGKTGKDLISPDHLRCDLDIQRK